MNYTKDATVQCCL